MTDKTKQSTGQGQNLHVSSDNSKVIVGHSPPQRPQRKRAYKKSHSNVIKRESKSLTNPAIYKYKIALRREIRAYTTLLKTLNLEQIRLLELYEKARDRAENHIKKVYQKYTGGIQ